MKASKAPRGNGVSTGYKPPVLPAICVGCGQHGVMAGEIRPIWCKCPERKFGPYQAPPGHVTCFVIGTPAEITAMEADDERGRLIKNEYIDARDAGSDARWTPSGRRRSTKSAIYLTWLARFTAACKALDALQAECQHLVRYRGCCVRCAHMFDTGSCSGYIDAVSGRLDA